MAQEVDHVTLLASVRGLGRQVQTELGDAWSNAEAQGSSAFSQLFRKITGWAAAAADAVGGYFSAEKIFGGGLDQLLNIEDAQAKLRGLGHDADSVAGIMTSALDAVRGTAYGLDSAATIAASAVAAGIQPGQELTKYLSLTADAASIAGTSLDEMGSILNQVTSSGFATTDSLNQLAGRGIPIFEWLQDEYGVTADELRKMVSRGEVDAETFRRVIEENIGGAALASSDTTRGALDNLNATLSQIGANLLGGVFPVFKEVLQGITHLLGPVEDVAKQVGDAIGTELTGGITAMQAAFAAGGDDITSSGFAVTGTAIDAIVTAVSAAVPLIVGAVTDVLPLIVGAVTDALPLIVSAVTGLAPPLAEAAIDLFTALVDAAIEILPDLLDAVVGILPPLTSALVGMLPHLLIAGIDLFMAFVDAVVQVFPMLLTTLVEMVPTIVSALLGMLPTLLAGAVALFQALIDAVVEIVPMLLLAILDILPPLLETLLAMLPDLLISAIDLFFALVTAVLEMLPELLNTLVSEVLPAVIETLVAMTPTLIATAIDLFMALVDGLIGVLPQLVATIVTTVIPALVQAIINGVPLLVGAGRDLLKGMLDGLVEKWSDIWDWVKGLPQKMLDGLGDLGRLLLDAGKQIMQGLWDGLKQKWDEVTGWFSGIGNWIADHKGPKQYDLALLVPAGGWIMAGLIAGLESKIPELRATLARVTDEIAVGASIAPGVLSGAAGDSGPGAGAPISLTVNPRPEMSEEAIGDAASRRLIFAMTGVAT